MPFPPLVYYMYWTRFQWRDFWHFEKISVRQPWLIFHCWKWHPPNFVTCSAPSMDHIRRQGENACGGDYFLVGPKRLKLTEHDKLLNKFLGTGELWCLCWEGIILGNVFAVMEELVSRRKLLKKCVSNLDLEKLVLL